ncbi:MAG: RNA 2',3'-cyclic phosphodiesterase [Chloroflexi bacterium]|nr:MAG: RNA 2',3'-cyclic phosphodiesterase [Chloroflexota bacterium]
MDAIRAFIAIELPEDIRQQLDAIEKQVIARAGDPGRRAVRWVPASNMHLTLKFLGEVSTGNLQALARVMQAEAIKHRRFEMTIGQLGAFPNVRRPRVIWVGTEAPGELSALQKAIEAETHKLGYPVEERPFSPHLTLGRISQNARPDEVTQVAHALGELKIGEISRMTVERIHLFRSDLLPTGAVYTSLYDYPLR